MIDQSLWRAAEIPPFAARPLPDEIDVAVIGGGITGLTAAYLLKRQGLRVGVFERERIGAGETGNTSAHLTFVTDLLLSELVSRFGRDAGRLVWQGGRAAIGAIEAHAAARGIACGFERVPGYLCAPFTGAADESKRLAEQAGLAADLGITAQYVNDGPITGRPAVRFADQAIVHPMEYIGGLALAVDGDGSFVREGAEVGQVIQDPLAIVVDGQTITCRDVVIATHVPMVGSTPLIDATLFQTKLYPYSSYVLGARIDDTVEPGLYNDLSDPYYFLRVHDRAGGRYAIFGGKDHKTGQGGTTEERFAALEQSLVGLIPSAKVERRWSGQVVETVDGLPYIGATADHQYVATGYAGNGLTFGTLAGMMISDAIAGKTNPLRDLFDPHRKASSVGAISTYVTENVDYPFYLIADRIRQTGRDGPENVPAGKGKVISIGGKRVACHRTEAGELVMVSAVCTHMGCLVRWNDAESTWDCPCHGSRFTPEGLVIGGPAEAPLPPITSASTTARTGTTRRRRSPGQPSRPE